MKNKPVLLCVMDGYGCSDSSMGNAIQAANTPRLDELFAKYPNVRIGGSGMDVGLPEGQMGNSEVGHTNIGAGRVVYQDLTRVTKSVRDGDFFQNEALLAAVKNASGKRALHLIGLMSDGGVHSHNSHAWALLKLAKQNGLERVYLHCLLDGRDVSPTSGAGFVEEARQKCGEIGVGEIATLIGRYYAMDRDNRWERVEKAYAALVYGEGERVEDPVEAIRASYQSGVTDEFVLPTVVLPEGRIQANDSVIFFNYRPDRAREITRAFVDPDFSGFARRDGFFPLTYVCLTQYDKTMPNVLTAYQPQSMRSKLGEYLSSLGLKQLRIAETEKYAHVTFFFNGGVEAPDPGEDRILVPSPKVATYDLQPEMSAPEVTDRVEEAIESGAYDLIVLNYANCDMVGHTGIFSAAVSAVETVDACVGRVWDALEARGGVLLLSADHGNADRMLEDDGASPFTAHTTNPVPFLIAGYPCALRPRGRLSDIAPTLLEVMGLPQPEEMTGQSMIISDQPA
ncbi:MAG: 2,3-bisphosphoglycerate-independent phosphoglycerate mutase [Oscillospiraceae bacterium]|nr:2,3-bisphosphoglycerate-independent phosphoglycerate mutase [Oscillospiraceae bacterium]